MRMSLIRTLALLMLLVLSASILPPDRSEAALLCLRTGQDCVSCGPDLRKKCTYYVCEDGSEYSTCTQCSLFCAVS